MLEFTRSLVRAGLLAVGFVATLGSSLALAANVPANTPAKFDVTNRQVILTAHAEGAQIYQCMTTSEGTLAWSLREPIATLLPGHRTIGRHYAGPTWELDDGSAVVGKLLAKAPGVRPTDVAWLKLDVVKRRGSGLLSSANLVLRLNTRGGVLQGSCSQLAELRAVAYSADYLFLE